MSTRKTTLFYAVLLAIASVAIGMVLASRLDLSPTSSAQPLTAAPPANSAPIAGAIDATTFRTIAREMSPGGRQHPYRVDAAHGGTHRVLRR